MLFSIIVPVYNAENFLIKTLDSIVSNVGNYEVILIDDGSSDGSASICQEYEGRYPQVHFYRKENGGVSSARNLGLDNAKGDFIIFVDADDYIESSTIQKLTSAMSGRELAFLSYGYDLIENGKVDATGYIGKQFSDIKSVKDLKDRFCTYAEKNELNTVYNKVFRREVIEANNLRFQNMKYGEDAYFVCEYLSVIDGECRFLTDILYHIYSNTDSATHRYCAERFGNELRFIKKLEETAKCIHVDEEETGRLIMHKYRMVCLYEIYNLSSSSCSLGFKKIKANLEEVLDNQTIMNALETLKEDDLLTQKEKGLLYLLYKRCLGMIAGYILLKGELR